MLSWWILSQSIACCVRRGPHTNGRPGDRTSTSPTLLNEFNWEHTEHARPRGRSVACVRGTSPVIISEETRWPEYTLLWLSNCEWNAVRWGVLSATLNSEEVTHQLRGRSCVAIGPYPGPKSRRNPLLHKVPSSRTQEFQYLVSPAV